MHQLTSNKANTNKLASNDETARTKLQAQIVDNLKLRAEIRKLNEELDSTRQSQATILALEASAKTFEQQLEDANNKVCQLRRELSQAQGHHTEEAKKKLLSSENAHKAECEKLCSQIADLKAVIMKNKEDHCTSDGAQQIPAQEAGHTSPSGQKKATSADNTNDVGANQLSQPPMGNLLSRAIANEEKAAHVDRTDVTRAAPNQNLQSPAEKAQSPTNAGEEKTAHADHADTTGDPQALTSQTTQPKHPHSTPGPSRRSRRAPREGHEPYQPRRHHLKDELSEANISSGSAGPDAIISSASVGPEEGSLDIGKSGMHEFKRAPSGESTRRASKKPMQESNLKPEQPTPDIPQTPMQESNLKPEQPTPDIPQTLMPREPPTLDAEDRSKDNSKGAKLEEINPNFNQTSMVESECAPPQQPTSGKGKKTNEYPKNPRPNHPTSAPTQNPMLDPKSSIAEQPTPGARNNTKGHPKEASPKQPTSGLPKNPMLDSRWAIPEQSTSGAGETTKAHPKEARPKNPIMDSRWAIPEDSSSGAREESKWPRPEKRSSEDPNSTMRDSKLARLE